MSRDTELAIQHPDWFYWIRSEDASTYAKPDFSNETLSEIHARIQLQNFTHLPAPDESYKNKFVQALSSVRTDTGEIQGITSDGTVCVLPPAFADYPPNDPQPSWDDITYLKFHTHASFNYVAYNTIRIYDEELQNPDTFSAPLWKHIEGVVFTWKKNYNLDGAFLDMSHALPYQLRRAIMKRARRTDEAFAFIDESFDISATAQEQGFNAVVGNVWLAAQRIDTLLERLDGLRNSTTTVSFLATPDTHNTPRVAMRHGTDDIKSIYSLLSDIPNGIPFVTSGSEFGERTPINTGLTFSNEETETYPASRLPLFSSCALDWKNADAEIINHIRSLFR
ncbi:MAG: hypothetical protein JNL32_16065 [Candidatus Kapabacteria bacterium]|nr:hypothetical protein [Candidatus Kapabacteria bacterium]